MYTNVKILIFSVALTSGMVLLAQSPQWVSTSPANKKVVIEQYTGQKCTYCPDGHKIADGLKMTDPNSVYLINIHGGTPAIPDANNYPMDFRTSVGESLLGLSGLTGFPAGAVNRANTPWALNRSTWASAESSLLAQSSPVNIAVRSSMDLKTSLLTTVVEVYYTDNGMGTFNRLSVMLLQDSILGNQIGSTSYYPENILNGQYIHNDVLRSVLNKNLLGDTMYGAMTPGTFKVYTFVKRIPSIIGNIELDWSQMRVVAFVSESSGSNIYTVNDSRVTYDNTLVPLNVTHIDNGTASIPFNMCTDRVTPKLKIINYSNTNITSCDVVVNINGVENVKTITDLISANSSKDITLPQINFTPNPGTNEITITGLYKINNANYYDNGPENYNLNFVALKNGDVLGDKSYNFETSSPVIDYSNSPKIYNYEKANFGSNVTWNIGAEGSSNATLVDIRSTASNSKPNNFLIGRANMINSANLRLSYHYAYSDGNKGGNAPKIQVYYSDDCGTTWKVLSDFTCTATATGVTSGYLIYIPKSTDYVRKEIDLGSLQGKTNLIFKLTVLPGSDGAGLWVDQIFFKNSSSAASGAVLDSFHEDIILTPTSTLQKEVTGIHTLIKDAIYTWTIKDVSKLVNGWNVKSLCDNNLCYDYPASVTQDFIATGNPTIDVLKLAIEHNGINGYGYVIVTLQKKGDPTTLKEYKFSMKVSGTIMGFYKTIIPDSVRVTIDGINNSATDNIDLIAQYVNLTAGDTVVWTVKSLTSPLALGWQVMTVEDNSQKFIYGNGLTNYFVAKGLSSENILKVNLVHTMRPGYGAITFNTYRTRDSAATMKTCRVAIQTRTLSSISNLADQSEKVLYYSDHTVFVDKCYQGADLDIFDMSGRKAYSTTIRASSIEFRRTQGIYFLIVSRNGERLKTLKFAVE